MHTNILPVFTGFYETIFDEYPLDFAGFEKDENGEYSDDASYPEDMEPVGRAIFTAFQKEFAKELEALGVSIEYERLVSPYYNYVNDQIYITVHGDISEEDFDQAFDNAEYRERLYWSLTE